MMKSRFAKLAGAAVLAAACLLAARRDWSGLLRKAGGAAPEPAKALALGAAGAAGRRRRRRVRPRAAAALAESNERLRLALAAGKMGTWTRDLKGGDRVVFSPELEAIVGLRPGEFPGTMEALYELIHPEDRELVRQAFNKAIRIKRDYEVEFRFMPRGRPPGWMLGRGRAYYDAAGEPVRLAGVAIDITARKTAELEVSRLNADLERRVQERTTQLEATNQELEAFAYSVSHDLRAPLRGIRGFSELLLDRYADKLDGEGRDYLRRACESSDRMSRLIDGLLKLARVGRCELHWQPVNLTALAEAAVAELRKSDPARVVEVVVQPNVRAEGDEHLLRLVLDNLLGNAWKFTSQRPEARIEFGRTAEPEPAFFVRDNGVGFDMKHAGNLFGVFQRLHAAEEFPGTGVGLATVQRIIKRHRGRVWTTGVVNQGAVFYFTLLDTQDFEL
jgi:PAS domain S-box-containing protein